MKNVTITISDQALAAVTDLCHLIPLSDPDGRAHWGVPRALSLILSSVDPRRVRKPFGKRPVGPTITLPKATRDALAAACNGKGMSYSQYIEAASLAYSTPTLDALRAAAPKRSVVSPLLVKHVRKMRRDGVSEEALLSLDSTERTELLDRLRCDQLTVAEEALKSERRLCELLKGRDINVVLEMEKAVAAIEAELAPYYARIEAEYAEDAAADDAFVEAKPKKPLSFHERLAPTPGSPRGRQEAAVKVALESGLTEEQARAAGSRAFREARDNPSSFL